MAEEIGIAAINSMGYTLLKIALFGYSTHARAQQLAWFSSALSSREGKFIVRDVGKQQLAKLASQDGVSVSLRVVK